LIRNAPARAALAFILGPFAVLAVLVGWIAATESLADARDPEGLAYLLAFTGFSLPGLVSALVLAWYMQRRASGSGAVVQLAIAGLTGPVVTCAGFWVVLELLGGGSLMSDLFILVFPAAIGLVGCLAFFGLGFSREVVA
jgi:hypothetical protein